ncbi:MAG: hypothetical protein IJ676_01430 [Clostridia bacterium]|nr:hypothetical protein [Clostridia bacterium]
MKQISVFIENEKGKLAQVASLLAKRKINLQALSVADTTDYGILRLVTDRTEDALDALTEGGYLAKVTDVLSVKIEDKPGSLSKIISALSCGDVSVEYTYAFTSTNPGEAVMVFRVDDNEKAASVLKNAGINASL